MRKSRLFALSLATALFALSAQAIVYIVPDDRDLVNDSKAIVIGTAIASHAELNASGAIVTIADFQVERVLKGNIDSNTIEIVELGGFLGDQASVVPGSPRYEQGVRYLVVLDRWQDGSWRTKDFQLGQFQVTTDLSGRAYLSRGGDEMIFGLDARDGSSYVDHFRAHDGFVRFIQTLAADPSAPAREDYFVDRSDVLLARSLQAQRKLVIAPNFTRTSYLLSGNFRWQSGPTQSWGYCCSGQYPSQFTASTASTAAVQAWNGAGTSINYSMGGETTHNGGLSSSDGFNTVLFNDPNNIIGSSGAFAVGGISKAVGTYTLADGFTYNATQEVDVVVTQNSKVPGFMTQQLAVALLTHEVGHTLGFRHADGTASPTSPPPACDPSTSECANSTCGGSAPFAVMAHCIQSPGIGLQTWDNDARQTVYGSGPVCTPPSISTQPQSPTINAGQSATLSVVAGGTSPFTYQWFVGTSGATSNPIAGATASSVQVSPSATTSYWVQVTGQCSPPANSNTATVTVNCTPVITAQPLDQQVTSGSTATLSVSFSSASSTTVQWFRGVAPDTSNLAGTGTPFTTPAITSATSFWAKLTNSCGSVNTRTVSITIASTCTAPNNATASASATTINAGQQVTLQVGVGGTSPLSFQWFRGTSGDQSNPIAGATTFSIIDTPSGPTANYWVKISNTCGTLFSNTVTITVIGTVTCVQPSISSQPPSPTILAGQTATLTVAASGTDLHYAWFRGTNGQTGNPVGTDSPSFTTAALFNDTQFWVRVSNSCGAADSLTTLVHVKPGRRRAVHH